MALWVGRSAAVHQGLSGPLPLPVTCPVLEGVGSAVLALGPRCLLAAELSAQGGCVGRAIPEMMQERRLLSLSLPH